MIRNFDDIGFVWNDLVHSGHTGALLMNRILDLYFKPLYLDQRRN